MIGVDTNVLVRYFTRDDPVQAAKARSFVLSLGAGRKGHVSLVTLAELVWVLSSVYRAAVSTIDDVLSVLLTEDRFQVQDSYAAWAALDLYRQGGVDYADALLAAVDSLHGCSHTVTFDRVAARSAGMTLLT